MVQVRMLWVNENMTEGKNNGMKRSPFINYFFFLQTLFKVKSSPLLKVRSLGKCLLRQAPYVKIEILSHAQ